MSIEGRGKRPYKVWDSGRTVRKGIVVSTFTELVEKGREKLELGDVRVRVVLEADGTHVDDAEYFSSLPENTVFLLLRQGEHWYPAGVEAIRQAITAIPKIVCETIYSLGLHDEAPVWKVMDQYGKITVVLSWDPCHRGPPLQHASPRKPAGTARVIVSGIGENAVQRHHEALTSHAVLSTTPSITTGTPGGMVHGTVTTILRDGKKETIINDVGSLHQGALVNHDGEHKTTFIGRLSRQGSSVESGHSAIHVHTPECCTRGHPTPVLPTRASPTGEQQECDFHCCTLHEETSRLPGRDRHHHHHHHQQQQTSQHPSSQQILKPTSTSPTQQEIRRSHSSGGGSPSPVPSKPGSIRSSSLGIPQKTSSHVRFQADYRASSSSSIEKQSIPTIRHPKDGDSSESETENTTNDDDGQLCQKFLLLIDQPSIDVKRHLSIKDIGVILDRLSSKIVDVERLDRESEEDDCFNWTIKAMIRGDSLRELGVLYGGHYYTICEHPAYTGTNDEEEEEEDKEDEENPV
ncbi:uncharacterized protein LOC108671040 isoform X2 [Hyalella azteca]|uniref:Uncharacterized protein LOC108671040 isoform X2 n=1 Tax=Hyalella azteca TaxID=294128 RepID=A0A979FLI4_HYAAZ|nr:uncharacterized protein LOC108671040 isoform X2 [Hyalella azteca]